MEPYSGDSAELSVNVTLVRSILTGFLCDGVNSTGMSGAVIGLSGGVDSTLVAFLAAEALGPERVLGLMMPFRTSSPDSMADARLAADKLGIRTELVDISPMVDAHTQGAGDADRMRIGNIMARERMIVLYDRSARERAMVVGTSNKTEILLGYGTLFGDTACGINPIGDLYKTQVWQMAAAVGVPERIISKPPSADLWKGQTDEEELGFSYREVDRLLFHLVDGRRTTQELITMGFDEAFVRKVESLIRKNQFKRRPPVVAKISGRTVNVDFQYPKDWGI
jgi:NAD+ synthase